MTARFERDVEPNERSLVEVSEGTAGDDATRSARAARVVFAVLAAGAIPVIMLGLGRWFWFWLDDWHFVTEREIDSGHDLFAPHNGHWSTVPVVAFRVMWALFGMRTYVPYQLPVVLLHIGVVVLVRIVMRRAGVGPWLATATAGALLLFGPGRDNIIWAFQVGFTGAIFFGLAQLLLADHDGSVDRRDVAALVAGVAAIMSAGAAVPLVVATGLTLLARRGWRRALLHTAPLAALYVVWSRVMDAGASPVSGLPDLRTAIDWVRHGYAAVFLGLGRYTPVSWGLGVLMLAGLALLVADRAGERAERVRRAAGPLALLVASLVFMLLTWQARWYFGAEGARAGRYVYVGAVLTVPVLAVAATELARRWRAAGPVLVGFLLVAVPANIAAFDAPPIGPVYHEYRKALITSVVRVPYARDLPTDIRPLPDVHNAAGLNMGFLLRAVDAGKLVPSTGDIPPQVESYLDVALVLQQRSVAEALELAGVPGLQDLEDRCRIVTPAEDLEPSLGTIYTWDPAHGDVRIQPVPTGDPAKPAVTLRVSSGSAIVAQVGGRRFDWEPVRAAVPLTLCALREGRAEG